MAEIRCPMCGKPNPDDLEVCQFCEARLKPLVAPTPEDPTPSEPEPTPETHQPDSDLPDWLRSIRHEEDVADEDELEEGPQEDDFDAEAVDWLERIQEEDAPALEGEMPSEEEEEPFVPPERDEEGLGRLGDLEQTEKPELEQTPTGDVEHEAISEWEEEAASAKDTIDETGLPDETEQELPDWLSDIGAVGEEESPEETPSEEELPEWISQYSDEEVESSPPAPAEDEMEAIPLEEEDSPREEEADDLPEWLAEMEASAPEVIAEESEQPPVGEEEGTPSFHVPEEPETEGEPPLGDELPEWISATPEGGDEEEIQEVDEEGEIAPADLPAWLAAMRPTEVDVPEEEEEEKIEAAGPLVGLRDTLTAEPEIARVKRPPAYSVKLNITENQGKHAKVWERILAAEGEPRSIPQLPILTTQKVLRWLIALILLIVVAGVVIADSQLVAFPDPALIPSEVLDTSRLINGLPSEAPVLLAFDYEPGLTGEMDATAAAVVDHLMLKGTRLALISTSPTGPVVAERFINQVLSEHGYVSGGHYINLGYVPGGISGLLSFAQIPQRVTPLSFDGLNAWGTRPLQGISALDDFSLTVVITDNPETARAWVEQVQPNLGQTPLVMVVSAQAEPLVRPYLESVPRQVDGLVSSLTGGAAYEELTGRSSLVRRYWDAFSAGLLIAVGAILVGGIFNLANVVLVRLREEKETQGEAK